MKRVISFVLLGFLLISIFGFSLVLAEEGDTDNSGSDDNNDLDASDENDNDDEIEVRERVKDKGDRLEIERRIKVKSRVVRAELRDKFEARLDRAEDRIEKIKEFRERMKERRDIRIENRDIRISEISDERKEIIAGKINAKTGLNLTADDIGNKTILRAYLSNGKAAHVRHLPDEASEIALKRLRAKCEESGCEVELREVGEGDEARVAYEVRTEKDSRFLFIFKNRMKVRAEVDADTGEIISVKRPWWAFLASEEDATDEEIEDSVSEETDDSDEA